MNLYIGNTDNKIDWDYLIDNLKKPGERITVDFVKQQAAVDFNKETESLLDPDEIELRNSYEGILKTWIDANYILSDITWIDYYPYNHFDNSIVKIFSDIVQSDPLLIFISELEPGRNGPYHWDVADKEKEWLKSGPIVRYVCFINKPQFGHVFILEDQCFYNEKQGNIYEWNNYRDYHAGTNCGSTPYFLFHFIGHKR